MITLYLEFDFYFEKLDKYLELSKKGYQLEYQDYNSKTNKYQLFMSKRLDL